MYYVKYTSTTKAKKKTIQKKSPKDIDHQNPPMFYPKFSLWSMGHGTSWVSWWVNVHIFYLKRSMMICYLIKLCCCYFALAYLWAPSEVAVLFHTLCCFRCLSKDFDIMLIKLLYSLNNGKKWDHMKQLVLFSMKISYMFKNGAPK